MTGAGSASVAAGCSVAWAWAFCLLLAAPSGLAAQTFQGRVLEDGVEVPVATALVSLLDEEGEQVGVSIADSTGAYSVQAPAPGIYRLRAERIGYAPVETPLLEAGMADGTYPVDLLLQTDPYDLPGFTVMSERVSEEEADREIRLMIGLSPRSLRFPPIGFDAIQDHVDRDHRLAEMLQWQNLAGLVVRHDLEGPCFSVRGRGCLPVYLNGFPLRREFVETIPLEMLYRVVVVTRTDSTPGYPSGAVLLYTEAWLR